MGIMYGGDYNPNQWPRDIWEKDMELFAMASVNTATVNVFSWASLQKNDDGYDFSVLDDIAKMLADNNYNIIMATPTSTLPAWLAKKYPEVLRTDYNGVHKKYGQRHHFCPNSPIYKKYSQNIVRALAERYRDEQHIVCWHIGNEFGGECFCENCAKEFRNWLKKRYKTIDNLNKAWNSEFWSHHFYDWDEIVPPNNLGDGEGGVAVLAGLSLDYKRFFSESLLDCYTAERDIIKSVIPNAVCTTNLMGTCKTLDYFAWAKEMDVVSWDNYPSYNTPPSETAMNHDLMRGLKNKPFLLMEQAPSQQNWQPYNSLKKPGEIRAQSFQSIAHGADSVLFFQLRQSVGGCEKFHSAVISHSGRSDTRVFRELSDLGAELKKIGDKTIGAVTNAKVAIIFDWENYWALEYSVGPTRDMRYVEQIHRFYEYFYKNNIPVDMVSASSDLSDYSLVAAPVLYMVEEDEVKRLESFVKNGGTLITGFMSGLTDKNDNIYTGGYPGLLKRLCGLWVEEFDALAPEQKNELSIDGKSGFTCNLLCDIIRPETATPIAEYASNFYYGMPAVTVNAFGNGKVYYFGTQTDKEAFYLLMDGIVKKSGVNSLVNGKTELEVSCREKNGKKYYFIINFSDNPQRVPKEFYNTVNLPDGSEISEKTVLKKYDVLLIEV